MKQVLSIYRQKGNHCKTIFQKSTKRHIKNGQKYAKPAFFNKLTTTLNKIKQKLLSLVDNSTPRNYISGISSAIQISRQTLLQYFQYLEDAKLIFRVFKESRGLGALEKPDKIFLENTNLMFLLGQTETNIGNVRETFAYNQLSSLHEVLFSEQSDFLVDKEYTLEVGGKGKTRKQIKDIPNSYIIADDIEYGTEKRIPLWLLGFLY